MVHLPYWMASPALSSDASETAEKSFPEDFRILCVKIYNGWNQWIPKRFPEINPLANRLSSFRSAPGERAHIHGFPPGTSIGIYDYFTYFSRFCKREKTGIQWKFHDCSKFICRNHRLFGVFLHRYLCIRRWESKSIMRSLKPKVSDYIAIYALFAYSSPRFALHGTAAAGNICQSFDKKWDKKIL